MVKDQLTGNAAKVPNEEHFAVEKPLITRLAPFDNFPTIHFSRPIYSTDG